MVGFFGSWFVRVYGRSWSSQESIQRGYFINAENNLKSNSYFDFCSLIRGADLDQSLFSEISQAII